MLTSGTSILVAFVLGVQGLLGGIFLLVRMAGSHVKHPWGQFLIPLLCLLYSAMHAHV